MNELLKQRLQPTETDSEETVEIGDVAEAIIDLVADLDSILGDDVEEAPDVTDYLVKLRDLLNEAESRFGDEGDEEDE